ncbi:helix-turn-helix domain-containing protein [Enterococcus sp. C76]|uniref:helix-turn-helix domain-containing protein n=1 Tax=Enterococcus sp. C76 TaxID=3231334 RepID=UPI0034A00FA5
MLLKYIEKNILRKIYIIEKIFKEKEIKINELIEYLQITKPTFFKDFSQIQLVFGNQINVQVKKNIMIVKEIKVDYNTAAHQIYRQSDFLNVLGFMVIDKKIPFKEYVDQSYCSRAKIYAEKKKVEQYFREVKINENELVKRVLLASKLEIDYGIDCIPAFLKEIYLNHVEEIVANFVFLSFYEKKIYSRVVLCIIQAKNMYSLVEKKMANFIFEKLEIPREENRVFNMLSDLWKLDKSGNDELVRFFYKIISANIYYPPVRNDNWLLEIKSLPIIQSLLSVFEVKFGEKLIGSEVFLGVFFNCVKCLDLEISDFLLSKEELFISYDLYIELINLFVNWKEVRGPVDFSIDTECIKYLGNKLNIILKKENKLKLCIYSESFLEYIEIYQFLLSYVKIDSEIVDFWALNLNESPIFNSCNHVIVAKLEHCNKEWLKKKNTVYLKTPLDNREIFQLNKSLLTFIAN